MDSVAVVDTSICTDNLGDEIIMDAVNDGIMRGRLKVLQDEFQDAIKKGLEEQRLKEQVEQMRKQGQQQIMDDIRNHM